MRHDFTLSLLWLAFATPSFAGGGGENLALIVNADSESSRRIAAVYAELRQVPACNVIRLKGIPDQETIAVDVFREKILQPIFRELTARGVLRQIDCVAYSSDFPTAIDVRSDIGDRKLPKVFTSKASINGLTFLHELVTAKNLGYLQLNANRYYRRPLPPADAAPLPLATAKKVIDAVKLGKSEEKLADAVGTLQEVLQAYPKNAGVRYNLACLLARQAKLDVAMGELKTAVQHGWWNRRHTERDADLKALRGREEFQHLLGEMGKRVLGTQASVAFCSSDAWNAAGVKTEAGGQKYLLSTILAVTRGRGTTVEEAIACLKRSAAADGTKPVGTVYFVQNNNVRSTTRDGVFPSAVALLKEQGVRAEIVSGTIPQEKTDVRGAMIGTATFDWKASGSRIQPGAICEHLTSFGGVMRKNAAQTPLSELLRNGAAGASGTVTEPYAIAAKFPTAFLHVHYARGCSLAESYYQSVASPYQLLIVGDPLCQPWAQQPRVTVKGIADGQFVTGTVRIQPTADVPISRWEFYVDGVRTRSVADGERLDLTTESLKPGQHEIRVVAVTKGPIATRGRWIGTVVK